MDLSIRTLAAAAALALGLAPDRAEAAAWFATECQQSFQGGHASSLPYTWTRCSKFNQELNDTDYHYYYWNLVGAKPRWEKTWDESALDDVDLVYATTHGGAWDEGQSVWTMWDWEVVADSRAMRLGDEAWQLSILATYACNTLKHDDGLAWSRMGPIFDGGLRYALGSHDKVWAAWTTDEVGEDFADGLQKGKTLRYAWKDGNSDWDSAQDITVMTTGATSADCSNRRVGMKWQNFPSYPRLRDWEAQYICWTRWDDL